MRFFGVHECQVPSRDNIYVRSFLPQNKSEVFCAKGGDGTVNENECAKAGSLKINLIEMSDNECGAKNDSEFHTNHDCIVFSEKTLSILDGLLQKELSI